MKLFFRILLAVIAVAAVLTGCACSPATPEGADTADYDAAAQLQIAGDSLTFLQSHIPGGASFGEIADTFEQLCAKPTAGELILFEAGTSAYGSEPMFTVSLVRQIPNGADEFYQIRADVSFSPDADNRDIEETIWLDFANGDDFSAMRQSKAFAYADTHTASAVELHIEET